MELWDLYDKNRNLLGKDHIRGERLPDDTYHLVVHVWIQNNKGQYLISQRSASRLMFPLMWECVGGSVLKGESSYQGAIREVKEEVGLDLDRQNGELLFSEIRTMIDGRQSNSILDVWRFHYDGNVALSQATTDEVHQVCWMFPEEIKNLYNSGKLVHTLQYFFDLIQP